MKTLKTITVILQVVAFGYSVYIWWVYVPHYTFWVLCALSIIIGFLTYLTTPEYKP